jgi:hypothetical protein
MPLLSFTLQQAVYASLGQECFKSPHTDNVPINESHTEYRNSDAKTFKTVFKIHNLWTSRYRLDWHQCFTNPGDITKCLYSNWIMPPSAMFYRVLFCYILSYFRFSGALAKLRKVTISFVMSVRPSARNNSAPTDGFSRNLTFGYFTKICQESSSVTKIWQE